jgi:glutamate--cysteine ligase
MPTHDRSKAVSFADAHRRAGFLAFPPRCCPASTTGVGLEPEFFPLRVDADGKPTMRMILHDPPRGVLSAVGDLAVNDRRLRVGHEAASGVREFQVDNGGRITFEPGGQVEHSTCVHPNPSAALDDVDDMSRRLSEAFRARGARLAAVGMDQWTHVENIPQQLPGQRYVAQAAYYDRRGRWGAVMMRHTASLQINVDLGREGIWQERWLTSNALAPILTAAFACSPTEEGVATRARAWQELDPTRSGFPRLLLEGAEDPREQWATAAMEADVMLFRSLDAGWSPGEPGFTMGRWIEHGHPDHGWPTVEDFDYHLTTLFFEVRARGFLELRTGEALPVRWRSVPVIVASTLVYDDIARHRFLELISPQVPRLDELWGKAARVGVRDDELRGLAERTLEIVLERATELSPDLIAPHHIGPVATFADRYTARGRMPADRLTELLARDPAEALEWATAG